MIYPIVYDGKTYSKIYRESNYPDYKSWYEAVEKIETRLKHGVFKDLEGRIYKARFKIKNLSIMEKDTVLNLIFTVERIFKFKWKYVQISNDRAKLIKK